jgi:hypothetical protein
LLPTVVRIVLNPSSKMDLSEGRVGLSSELKSLPSNRLCEPTLSCSAGALARVPVGRPLLSLPPVAPASRRLSRAGAPGKPGLACWGGRSRLALASRAALGIFRGGRRPTPISTPCLQRATGIPPHVANNFSTAPPPFQAHSSAGHRPLLPIAKGSPAHRNLLKIRAAAVQCSSQGASPCSFLPLRFGIALAPSRTDLGAPLYR